MYIGKTDKRSGFYMLAEKSNHGIAVRNLSGIGGMRKISGVVYNKKIGYNVKYVSNDKAFKV